MLPRLFRVLYGPANDPQIGPQMIPRPEVIPANGVAKIENGVDSMNSLLYMDVYCL